MKRIISFLISFLMVISVAGCQIAQKGSRMIRNTFGISSAVDKDEQGVHLILYFPSKDGKFLIPQERVVDNGKSIEKTIAQEIIKGPMNTMIKSPISKRIKVISVSADKNILILNLTSDFISTLTENPKAAESIVYSFVNSITELPGVGGVIFKVNGKTPPKTSNLDFGRPFYRNRSLLMRNEKLGPDKVLEKEMNLEKAGRWLEAYQMMSDDGNNKNRKYYNAYFDEMSEMKEKGFLDVDFKVVSYKLDQSGKRARVMVNFFNKDSSGNIVPVNTAYFNCVKIDGVWMVDWLTTQ